MLEIWGGLSWDTFNRCTQFSNILNIFAFAFRIFQYFCSQVRNQRSSAIVQVVGSSLEIWPGLQLNLESTSYISTLPGPLILSWSIGFNWWLADQLMISWYSGRFMVFHVVSWWFGMFTGEVSETSGKIHASTTVSWIRRTRWSLQSAACCFQLKT